MGGAVSHCFWHKCNIGLDSGTSSLNTCNWKTVYCLLELFFYLFFYYSLLHLPNSPCGILSTKKVINEAALICAKAPIETLPLLVPSLFLALLRKLMVVYFGAVGSFSGSCLGHSTGDMITQFTDKAFLKHIQDQNWVTNIGTPTLWIREQTVEQKVFMSIIFPTRKSLAITNIIENW